MSSPVCVFSLCFNPLTAYTSGLEYDVMRHCSSKPLGIQSWDTEDSKCCVMTVWVLLSTHLPKETSALPEVMWEADVLNQFLSCILKLRGHILSIGVNLGI